MKITPLGLIAIAAGGYAIYKIVGKTLLIKNLSFNIASIQPSFQGLTPYLKIVFQIANPTADSLTVHAVTGDVYVNGDLVGFAQNLQALNITPYSSVQYSVNVKLSAIPLILEIIQMLQGKTGVQANVRVVGTVTVENVPFPLDLSKSIV